jgi:YD repeat-containing protein
VQQSDGTTITLGYDGSHDLTSIGNGAGATTQLAYNSSDQVTSVSQPHGSSGATATTRLSYVCIGDRDPGGHPHHEPGGVGVVGGGIFTGELGLAGSIIGQLC